MCGCGAVVRTTGAHHQVMGSIPTRKVFISFLVVSHTLPHITRSPFSGSGTPSSLSTLNHIMHIRTHAHIHAHLRSHTPKPHTSDLSIYAPRYH